MVTRDQPSTLKVLCVDDDEDIRTIIAMSLGLDTSLAIQMATSANGVMDELEQGFCPDVLLVDHLMPGTNGVDLVLRLRRAGKLNFPVVFLTAAARALDLVYFKQAGAAGTIAKPFDPLTLAPRLRAFCDAARN